MLVSLAGTGGFQDASGIPIAFGTLTAQLQQDITIGGIQIVAGRVVSFSLDANGNVISGSLQAPVTYIFRVYTSQGQLVWTQQVLFTAPPIF